ncbi:hypothetical protein HZH66_010053 [Vespula vulgaris]|uniref:Uncharacterized protein n=1 Tax=Vespula vulgaris TaxID=7454 RepID=A0A834JJX1_VESVU|nr:hypothetical protein HZH66_010053 [Vespula vulgaris]
MCDVWIVLDFQGRYNKLSVFSRDFRPSAMATEEGMLSGGFGSKLKCPTPISRLRVEKIEGGLMVAGVVIAANCQIALPAFGFLFMLVGAVLTEKLLRPYRDFWPVPDRKSRVDVNRV